MAEKAESPKRAPMGRNQLLGMGLIGVPIGISGLMLWFEKVDGPAFLEFMKDQTQWGMAVLLGGAAVVKGAQALRK